MRLQIYLLSYQENIWPNAGKKHRANSVHRLWVKNLVSLYLYKVAQFHQCNLLATLRFV